MNIRLRKRPLNWSEKDDLYKAFIVFEGGLLVGCVVACFAGYMVTSMIFGLILLAVLLLLVVFWLFKTIFYFIFDLD